MPSLIAFEGVSPRVAASSWLAPDVVLTGDVVVDEDASLWFGVVARGDVDRIEIGCGSNIQDRVVLHCESGFPTIVGAEVAIGHSAIVHGCRIGDGSLIGMGAIVLSGARIGEGALIGAGALVLEHTEIPPRSLAVGNPARVVRKLTADPGRSTCARYRELVRSYRLDSTGG